MAQQQLHPIFVDVASGNLEAVQQRVLADLAVLEERWGDDRRTPIMFAISCEKPAMALWLVEHRRQHGVSTADDDGYTALHYASGDGLLQVVQALVAAGASPAATNGGDITPLMIASSKGHIEIVARLLQLPAAKATIDHISQNQWTALSTASRWGRQPIVQLLLDAGADPTISRGPYSPLNAALNEGHHATAALLRHAIAEADRVRVFAACMGVRKGLCKDVYLKVLRCLVHPWPTKEWPLLGV